MTVVKVTQEISKTELKEIATFTVEHGFERLHRIFNVPIKAGEEYPVLLDEMSSDGQDLIGDPIIISASNALWLLRDFYSAPKKDWSKIKEAK